MNQDKAGYLLPDQGECPTPAPPHYTTSQPPTHPLIRIWFVHKLPNYVCNIIRNYAACHQPRITHNHPFCSFQVCRSFRWAFPCRPMACPDTPAPSPRSSGPRTSPCTSTSILRQPLLPASCPSSWWRLITSCPTSTPCSPSTWAWAIWTGSLARVLRQQRRQLVGLQQRLRQLRRRPDIRRISRSTRWARWARPAAIAVRARAPNWWPISIPRHMRSHPPGAVPPPWSRAAWCSPLRPPSRRAAPPEPAATLPHPSPWSPRARTECHHYFPMYICCRYIRLVLYWIWMLCLWPKLT